MRWWILSLFFVCPLFTALSLPLVPAQQQSPSSDWLALIRLTDCELPCWIGIVPGETTASEARRRVEAAYADATLYRLEMYRFFQSRVTHEPTGYQLSITLFKDNGVTTEDSSIVRSMILNPHSETGSTISAPTISDMQSVLGEPTFVRLASGADHESIALFYHEGRVIINVDDLECDQVLPDQQIIGVGLHDEMPPSGGWLSEPQEWRGFGYCYNFERKLS